MYNFFKYQQTVRLGQAQRRQQELYSQWLLKNQDKKQQAKQREKLKLNQWIKKQVETGKAHHVEDDHYRQWRFLKQFRDVQHQPNFLGYKTFRHKPSHQMNKYFNQRQRKQIQLLSSRKQPLVDSALIHQYQRGRSLRSQGPLHPKIQFRSKKQDHEYLNPRMKFHNVTDRERLMQKKNSIDQKFKSVYSSFEMKKSKIGVPRSSFYDGQLRQNKSRSSYDRYDIDTERSYRLKNSGFNNLKNSNQIHINPIQFSARAPYDNQQNLAQSKTYNVSKVMTARMPQVQIKEPRIKTYWKLAKTMEVQQGNKKLKQLLLQSQYDRTKDLSNLKMNLTCQNFKKRPVL